MARPKGLEPLTPRFVVWCSIQLTYGRFWRREAILGSPPKGKRYEPPVWAGRDTPARSGTVQAKYRWKREDFHPSGIVLPCRLAPCWLRLAAKVRPLSGCGWGWVLAPDLFVGQGRSRCGEHNEGNSSIKRAQKEP